MKIVGITMVRNEADIIEAMLRYNLQFLDAIHVVNHHSTDRTVAIVERLAGEGLSVGLEHELDTGYVQDLALTARMRRLAAAGLADTIVPLDADEFLKCRHDDLRGAIEALPRDAPSRLPWQTYVPTGTGPLDEPHVLRRITHRLEQEAFQYYKVIVPASVAEDHRYRLATGNHGMVAERTGKTMKNMPKSKDLAIAHFPVRSREQITAKAITGWLASWSNPRREPDECYHWKILYDRITGGQDIKDDDLGDMAVNYVRRDGRGQARLLQDPLPAQDDRHNLRYTEPARVAPLALLAETAEQMAAEVASLKRQLETTAPARRQRSLLRRLFR